MDAKDLEEKLSSHKVPDPSPEVRNQHLARARAAFMYHREESTTDLHETRASFSLPSLFGGVAVGALACLLLVIVSGKSDFFTSPPGLTNALSSAGHGVSLAHHPSKLPVLDSLEIHLLPAPPPAHPTPVVIEFRQSDLHYSFLSFVGQLVLVKTGAKMLSLRTEKRSDGQLALFCDQQSVAGNGSLQIGDLSMQARLMAQE